MRLILNELLMFALIILNSQVVPLLLSEDGE